MKLLVQPGDGIDSLTKAIDKAKKTIEIVIFRFDRKEVERSLAAAVHRGVSVRALIAHTNRAGEESLRQLELRLLAAGVVVARTADDLIRYHSKMLIVDHRELFILGFNYTFIDIEHSRSFGVITRSTPLVREALQLFEADVQRRPFQSCVNEFVVSPVNSRKQLTKFIKAAQKELLIYDPKISDPGMSSLFEARAKAGVQIRVIGRLGRNIPGVEARKLSAMRLHTRTMVRDGRTAFVGSQSLREAELDNRREVGLIFREASAVSRIRKIFEDDWAAAEQQLAAAAVALPAEIVAKKMAKAVARELPPLAPMLEDVVRQVAGENASVEVDQ